MANEVRDVKPIELFSHGIAKEYTIAGFIVKDVIDTHTGLEFDYKDLQLKFKRQCHDYMEDLVVGKKSLALEFASKIIYEVEPDRRKVKKGTGDKVWKFIFPSLDKSKKHTVFIAHYTRENATYTSGSTYEPLVLSTKQAALLAHETLARLVTIAMQDNRKMLTPLAAACFCKDDIDELAEKLDMTITDLLIAINQSTQSGGQYLGKFDVDIAICATIAATRNVKDTNLRKTIVTKIIKQYLTKGKTVDKERMKIIQEYAIGGIPSELSYENLMEMFEQNLRTPALLRLKKAHSQSELKSTILTPITPKAGASK